MGRLYDLHRKRMRENLMEIELVINTCYGGFSLSEAACRSIAKRKGIPLIYHKYSYGNFIDEKGNSAIPELNRWDPDLVQVVKNLGALANGECAKLQVVKVRLEDLIQIEQHDGKENINCAYN